MWLFRTRLCKTRTEAQGLIAKGRLRLTRGADTVRLTKPHFQVRPGDRISFMRHRRLNHVEVVAPGERRGPASEARTLYIDLEAQDGAPERLGDTPPG